MEYTETRLGTISRYTGRVVSVRMDRVSMPDGANVLREVVEHSGGVTIIPVDDEGFVYCVRQFRYPFAETLLEVPAGKLELDEDPLACAKRELSEETGISAGEIRSLGMLYTSPGYSGEVLHLYLARNLSFGESHPDENELLSVEKVHIDVLEEMIMSGAIRDAKTIAAVFKARRFVRNV